MDKQKSDTPWWETAIMAGSFVLFGAAFGGVPRLLGKGGIFQRLSIAAGFGWLSALSLRCLSPARRT